LHFRSNPKGSQNQEANQSRLQVETVYELITNRCTTNFRKCV